MNDLLEGILGAVKTEFKTVAVTETTDIGVPIGIGGCRAVRLYLNQYVRNSINATLAAQTQLYYGDSDSQEMELLRGQWSKLILCTNLNQVFIRNPFSTTGNVQVMVYK